MRSLTRKTILLAVKGIAILVLLVTAFTACRVTRAATTTEIRTVDSVLIVETVRDTVIKTEADSSLIRALIDCDSLGRASIKKLLEYQAGERLKPPRVDIDDNNILTATASVDSLKIYLVLKDRYEKHTTDKVQIVEKTVEVNRLTWWQKLWVKLGKTLTVFAAGYILIKLFKPKILTLWQKIKN